MSEMHYSIRLILCEDRLFVFTNNEDFFEKTQNKQQIVNKISKTQFKKQKKRLKMQMTFVTFKPCLKD